ncbi:MAG: pectate lyase precursor [Proteobacteria bacterium]|nr:pectate lyase precursor [Pseudomonadota bacterium]
MKKAYLCIAASALLSCSNATNDRTMKEGPRPASKKGPSVSLEQSVDQVTSNAPGQSYRKASGKAVSLSATAFPGAQGFGAKATGGRGGRVIKVTTLRPRGKGSLQAALNARGPRIIVFAVSGVIDGNFVIPHGDVTIAGQTAPGAGITIKGHLKTEYRYGIDNIVVRHIRVRPKYDGSAGAQFDSIQFSRSAVIMIDHVSVGFGVDETVDLYEAWDVTVQWSTIESSGTKGHPRGQHNYGLINGPNGARISVHHNLFAHHKNRCPAIANGPAEVYNNVAYNVRHAFVHHNPASGPFNIIGNYYKAGGDDTLIPFWFDDEAKFAAKDLAYYLHDNFVDDPKSACNGPVKNPWQECKQNLFAPESRRARARHNFGKYPGWYWLPVTVESARSAYQSVLARAGAFPRDVVTLRSVAETRKRKGRWGARMPKNLMRGLKSAAPPVDSDNDGMADAWEKANGLDPRDGRDHNTIMPTGYTAIEQYINLLAELLLAAP